MGDLHVVDGDGDAGHGGVTEAQVFNCVEDL